MTEESKPKEDGGEVDYKELYETTLAQSRKWESRAKENKEKADRYDELRSGSESIEDRIAALEADKQRLEDEKNRAKLVKSVAASTGVSESLVSNLSATDEDGLTAQAKAIAEAYKTPGGAPSVSESGIFPNGKKAEGATDEKRKFVRDLFGSSK
jgi:predicted nuclease with TOPRIM domain